MFASTRLLCNDGSIVIIVRRKKERGGGKLHLVLQPSRRRYNTSFSSFCRKVLCACSMGVWGR